MCAPILCYHKVGEPADRSLNVSVRDFRRQVGFLSRRFRLVTLAGWQDAVGRRAVLTFDDAYACATEPLLAVARDFDATGTVFPVTAFVGDASRWDGENARALADWDAMVRLHSAGYEIGNHTHTHADLSAAPTAGQADGGGPMPPPQAPQPSMSPSPWSEAEGGGSGRGSTSAECQTESMPFGDAVRVASDSAVAAEELAAAEREIEARLGILPKTFAYPFGRYDGGAVRAVRARGYLAAVTVRYGIASDRHDPHLLPRILISYSDGLPGLLYKLYIRPWLQGKR